MDHASDPKEFKTGQEKINIRIDIQHTSLVGFRHRDKENKI
jgi:hypothetical protein